MAKKSRKEQIIEVVKEKGVLRPKDLDSYGIPREYLSRLCERGLLQRVGRGLYVLADAEVTEYQTLAEASKRVPQGVLCLLSALQFHGLTTQAPFEVWMALEQKAWQPQVDRPRMRFVRFSGPAFESGIEEHRIKGVPVKVYCPAKTVADCFKYRNKIGLDVALEALRDCRGQRKCTNDELWHYAKICRVANVMKPYLEATL
jgi:predicted transcriptional regulator of viral defense system